MNRALRRHGEFTTVRGPVVAPECIEWMRARRRQQVPFTDSGDRYWDPQWTRYVGVLDLPRWRITEKPEDPDEAQEVA